MTNDIVPFDFQGHQVRVVTVDDQPWFVARDVAAVLGYSNPSRDVARHTTPAQRGGYRIGTPSGEQEVVVISEAGLYRLIMRSNMPEAEAFQDWIATDVLPSIRKHGGYLTPEMTERVLLDPDTIIRLATDLKAARAQAEIATREVLELTPKAEAWDVMVSAKGDYAVDEAAKILSRDAGTIIGRNRLFALMADMSWVYRSGARGRWHARQEQVDLGRLVERMSAAFLNAKTGEMEVPAPTIRITPKGLDALRKRMKEAVA